MDSRTEAEKAFHQHMNRWGSDGYPIQKVRGGWIWADAHGVSGAPTVYKTRREARAAIWRYLEILCDKAAGRL